MSIIVITDHDENITKISEQIALPNENIAVAYKTKLHARLKVDRADSGGIKSHATMGLPQERLPDPCDFLKKCSGTPSYGRNGKLTNIDEKHKCEQKKKLFPNKEDVIKYNKLKEDSDRLRPNFVLKNMKKIEVMTPKKPQQRVVVESHGEIKWLRAGLQPIYINSDAFGKTPLYLQVFIQNREKLHQMQKDATGVEKPKCRYIRRDEREELLKGLKHNWEELQKQYQGLPILTDTIPKINRKSKLEGELKQLEKDIVLVERHPYIYVYDDHINA